MKKTFLIKISILVLLFILFYKIDSKENNQYLAERSSWYMKKDLQYLQNNIESLPVTSVNQFISRCDLFLNDNPGSSLLGEVQDLRINAVNLKKSMPIK